MPQIIVTADHAAPLGQGDVMHSERVSLSDFESEHFARHLVERLRWAVADANAAPAPAGEATEPEHEPARA